MENFDQKLLQACIDAAWHNIQEEESIIAVRRGRTVPGRQVYHPFKVDIATLDKNLGEPPKNKRQILIVINQDSINTPDVSPVVFMPWDVTYDF